MTAPEPVRLVRPGPDGRLVESQLPRYLTEDATTFGRSVLAASDAGAARTLLGITDPEPPTWSEITGKPSTFTPSAHTHTIGNVTNLQSSLNSKADVWNGAITGGNLFMSPESGKAVPIPYFMNDIAYNNLRGGATRLYADGVESSTSLDICFEPTASARSLPVTATEYVIEIDLWKTFTYGTKVGYAAMESWRAKYVKIEAWDRGTEEWKLCLEDSNHPGGDFVVPVPNQSGSGITKLRYTFRDFNGASFRIGQLMLFNYSSEMGASYFLPRNGGTLYGNISGVTPTSAAHLTRKDYVDTQVGSRVATDDPRLTDARTPLAHTHTIEDVQGLAAALEDAGGSTSLAWADITDKPSSFPPSAHTHDWADVTGKPTTFAPSAHKHPVADITTTNSPTATTFLRGDGQWIVPTNTTYTALTLAEFTTGTATTVRGVSAQLLNQQINQKVTGSSTTAPTAFGHSMATAADAGAARLLIGAAASVHTHSSLSISDSTELGRTLLTAADPSQVREEIGALGSDYSPGISDVTGLQTALETKATKASGTSGTGLPWASEIIVNSGALESGYNDGIGGVMTDKPIVLEGMVFRIADPSKTIGGTGNLQIEWYQGTTDVLEGSLMHTSQLPAGQRDVWVVLAVPLDVDINACLRAKFTIGSTVIDGPCHVQWRGRYQ